MLNLKLDKKLEIRQKKAGNMTKILIIRQKTQNKSKILDKINEY